MIGASSIHDHVELGTALTFFAGCFAVFVSIAHGVFFYVRYRKRFEASMSDGPAVDWGFLTFYMTRMFVHGVASLWPAYGRSTKQIDMSRLAGLDADIRFQLRTNTVTMLTGGFLMVLGAIDWHVLLPLP